MAKLNAALLSLLLILVSLSTLIRASAQDFALEEIPQGKVAVMFWSGLCSTCEKLLPHWRAIEQNPPFDFKVMDIELIPGKTDRLFQELGIRETPTFIVFDNGREVRRMSGNVAGDPERSLRKWIEGKEGNSLISSVLSFSLLGGLISFSPCSLPLAAALLSVSGMSRRRDYLICFLSFAAGIAALGSIVILISSLAIQLVKWLSYGLALAVVALGLYSLILPERSCRIADAKLSSVRGPAACFSSAFLMMQCNFPILTGSLILLGSLSDPIGSTVSLITLSFTMSLSLIILLSTSRRLAAKFTKNASRIKVMRLSGLVLIFLGVYYLLQLL